MTAPAAVPAAPGDARSYVVVVFLITAALGAVSRAAGGSRPDARWAVSAWLAAVLLAALAEVAPRPAAALATLAAVAAAVDLGPEAWGSLAGATQRVGEHDQADDDGDDHARLWPEDGRAIV